jgi:hypothetical protein
MGEVNVPMSAADDLLALAGDRAARYNINP